MQAAASAGGPSELARARTRPDGQNLRHEPSRRHGHRATAGAGTTKTSGWDPGEKAKPQVASRLLAVQQARRTRAAWRLHTTAVRIDMVDEMVSFNDGRPFALLTSSSPLIDPRPPGGSQLVQRRVRQNRAPECRRTHPGEAWVPGDEGGDEAEIAADRGQAVVVR